MKLQVLGVKRMIGISAKTQAPFDFCTLFAMVPVEQVANPKLKITGAGFELAEVALLPESLPAFLSLKFPLVLDLHTDSQPKFGKFETVVTGFTPIAGVVSPVAKVA